MEDVRKTRPYISENLLAAYRVLDVATVHEALGKRGAMVHQIKPLDPDMKMCGRALTVKCHAGDNIMLIKAASMARPCLLYTSRGRLPNALSWAWEKALFLRRNFIRMRRR